MAANGAIVRHLASVETLGSVTTICSDKTGTLTVGLMKQENLWIAGGLDYFITGEGIDPKGEFVNMATTITLEHSHSKFSCVFLGLVLLHLADFFFC